MTLEDIRTNIQQVEAQVARACQRAGRERLEVRIIAVTKTFPAESIQAALDAGVEHFGENRVQEALAKFSSFRRSRKIPFKVHLIGHLQTNKAKRAVEIFDMIQTVDRLELAQKLNHHCEQLNRLLPVLIQVSLGNEETKSGVEPHHALELVQQVSALKQLRVRGLMAIPPFSDEAEDSRAHFRSLRLLAEKIRSVRIENVSMNELSMGMSHDFEVAIEEGATLIRVGTAIFGKRTTPL